MARRKPFICPGCGNKFSSAYSRAYPIKNSRVKYFKCKCGRRFKSIERLIPINKSK